MTLMCRFSLIFSIKSDEISSGAKNTGMIERKIIKHVKSELVLIGKKVRGISKPIPNEEK